MENYSALLEEYGPRGISRFTPVVMTLRVAFAIPLLVIMSDHPTVQSTGFLLLNLLVFSWFVVLRPGDGAMRNVMITLREGLIIIINCLYAVLAFDSGDTDFYGIVIVASMVGVYLLEMLSGLIDTILTVASWIRDCCQRDAKSKSEAEISSSEVSPVDISSKSGQTNRPASTTRLCCVGPRRVESGLKIAMPQVPGISSDLRPQDSSFGDIQEMAKEEEEGSGAERKVVLICATSRPERSANITVTPLFSSKEV